MGVVHSSHDTIYVQEVEQLKIQKNEAKDEEGKKVVEKKIAIKSLERDLAASKMVRQRKLTLRQMYAMKLSLVVCSGVCGEQLLTLCLCKGCSVYTCALVIVTC